MCIRDRAAPHHLPIGTVLRSKKGRAFLFGEVKGDGGFGLTYIAKELTTGTVVAIKEYFPVRCQPQRSRDLTVLPATQCQEIYRQGMHSFLSEASMLRAVGDVPSIVHVMDYFEANGTAYMVMEYLDLSLIHISEPTRQAEISYAVFCLKKKKKKRHEWCSTWMI